MVPTFTATSLPSYGLLNMRLDWNNVENYPIDLSMYVRNAANRIYYATPVASGAFLGMTSAIPGAPRMFGGEFRVRFGK